MHHGAVCDTGPSQCPKWRSVSLQLYTMLGGYYGKEQHGGFFAFVSRCSCALVPYIAAVGSVFF